MKWININDKLPDKNVNVHLHADNWKSTGWMTDSGYWSIAQADNVTILSKPTHWAKIKQAGRPKSEKPKIRCTFRLDAYVVSLIKSKPNQAKYIEYLVIKESNLTKH